MCWRYEVRDGKPTKVPYKPTTGKKASPTDRETWGTFTEARRAYERSSGHYEGIGFVFAEDAGIAGVDLDKCRDPETGQLEEWAAAIVARFMPCYAEVSPSQTGVHLLILGALPTGGRRRKGKIEMYDGRRFFTLTGDVLDGSVTRLEDRQDALDALYGELFPVKPERPSTRSQASTQPLALDDQALLAKASNPKTSAGREFAALWAGDWAGKPSASEADFALAKHLAWWTRHDAERIERLMRTSGLAREKWDKKDGAGTHLDRTINNAILALGSRMYSGAKGDSMPEQVAPVSEDVPAQKTTGTTGQNDCCAVKDKIIANLQRELKKKQARIEELEAAQRWEKKARANKGVSATTKAVARTLIEFHQRAKPIEGQPNHLRKVWYEKIAKDAGVSESTVKAEIDKLVTMGGLEKAHLREDSEKQRRRVTRALIAPTPVLLEKFETLEDPKHLNHGGDRRCPECGSMHLRIKTRTFYTCVECKHTWEKESAERIQRGNEEEMRARSDAMLAQDDSMGEQVAPEDCPIASVQIETGQSSGLNHHDERAELLALVEVCGYRTRLPIGLNHNEGGTLVNWQTFAAQADNALIDEALRQLRIRREAVS